MAAVLLLARTAAADGASEPAADAASDLAASPDAASEPLSVAVLDLAADPGAELVSRNLGGLITARLASASIRVVGQEEVRTALGFEKARAAAGCADDACLVEIGGALGVRYLAHGALGKVGKTFVLRLVLTDLRQGTAIHRAVRKEESEDALIAAAESAADEVAARLGLAPPPRATPPPPPPAIAAAPPPAGRSYQLNLKLGNTFASLSQFDVGNLNLSFDVEGDIYFTEQLAGFVQIGLVLGQAQDMANQDLSLTIVPAAAGLKLSFMPAGRWNPYAGLGLGLGVISAFLTRQESDAAMTFNAMAGIEYLPWPNLGFNLEGSFNLASLDFADRERLQLALIHTNFGLLYLW